VRRAELVRRLGFAARHGGMRGAIEPSLVDRLGVAGMMEESSKS
jgi:hypothetical protein